MNRTLFSGLLAGALALAPMATYAQDEEPAPPNSPEAEAEKLETDLERKLDNDERLQGSDIDVEVVGTGDVTLTGTVPSENAHDRALRTVRGSEGVEEVDDQLELETRE
jgi:osmotically-inducible protein OsmY